MRQGWLAIGTDADGEDRGGHDRVDARLMELVDLVEVGGATVFVLPVERFERL